LSITIVLSNHDASVESVARRIQSFQNITKILIIGITQVGSAEKTQLQLTAMYPKFTKYRAELTQQLSIKRTSLSHCIESRGDPVAELPLVGYCRRYFHLS